MLSKLARWSSGAWFVRAHATDAGALHHAARHDAVADVGGLRRRQHISVRSRQRRDWRSLIELIAAAAIGGSSFLFLRIDAPVFGPAPLIDLRLAIGAVILAPFIWRSRAQLAAAGWWKIVAIGAFTTLVPFLLFAWSSERASAGVNAIVFSMSVPFTALAAFVLLGERMGGRRVLGMLAGLAGVVVLAGGMAAGIGVGTAVAVGTLATVLYGVAANLVRQQFAGVPATALVAAMLASSALMLAPFAAWLWPATTIPARAWVCAVILGVLGTAVLYVLYFRLIQRIGAPRAVMIAYLAPVFAVLWAWLALGEALTTSMALGGALILGGMVFAQTRARTHRATREVTLDTAIRPCVECGD